MGADAPKASMSAGQMADLLGDRLPRADDVSPEAFALVERVRELVEAVVLTDIEPAEQRVAANRIAEVTAHLLARRREHHLRLVRHADGRVESLTNAGSGRLNPQSPPLVWIDRPTEPPSGSTPEAVEVRARCTLTAAHAGSPDRVHGSVIAGLLDEVTGVAIRAAGARGMTVALDVSFRGALPIGVLAEITARYTGGEGRKSYAAGEITVEGRTVAEATVVYVAERS